MANKSSLNVTIDNGSGITLQVQDDASLAGGIVITMSDGKTPLAMKLAASDSHAMRSAMIYADALRSAIPQS